MAAPLASVLFTYLLTVGLRGCLTLAEEGNDKIVKRSSRSTSALFSGKSDSYDVTENSDEEEWRGIDTNQLNSGYNSPYQSGDYQINGYQPNFQMAGLHQQGYQGLSFQGWKGEGNGFGSSGFGSHQDSSRGKGWNTHYPVPYQVPVNYPVPIKIRQPLPIHIPVPVPLEKTVTVPVERPFHYPVEKPVPYTVIRNIPVPVPQPYPVPVPVYRTKIVVHGKSHDR